MLPGDGEDAGVSLNTRVRHGRGYIVVQPQLARWLPSVSEAITGRGSLFISFGARHHGLASASGHQVLSLQVCD